MPAPRTGASGEDQDTGWFQRASRGSFTDDKVCFVRFVLFVFCPFRAAPAAYGVPKLGVESEL